MRHLCRSLALAAVTATLALLAPAAMADKARTEVLWLGQSTVRITTPAGKVIVIDPWVRTNPKTPAAFKRLEALGKVDLVLVTHAHYDHFADAPDLARMHQVPLYGPAGLNQTVATLGILPAELTPRLGKGGSITPFGETGLKITALRAEHSSELVWKDASNGKMAVYPGGEPQGFMLELENGFKIYHMGDTALFGDLKFIGDYYKPDLVLIPIDGHFVMNPKDAAYALVHFLKPKYAVPIHFGTTPLQRGTPAELGAALGEQARMLIVIEPGQNITF